MSFVPTKSQMALKQNKFKKNMQKEKNQNSLIPHLLKLLQRIQWESVFKNLKFHVKKIHILEKFRED